MILGKRRWPWPKQVASNSFSCLKALCLEWLEVIRQAPAIKQDTQQQLGRVTLGPPPAGGRQETVPRNSAI